MTRPRKSAARRPHKHRKEKRGGPTEGSDRAADASAETDALARGSGRRRWFDGDASDEGDAAPPATDEPVVVLDRRGVKRLAGGHPWLFADHVAVGTVRDGGVVRLEGPAGVPRGWAVHSAGSRIPLRVVERDPAAELPDDWAVARLDEAVRRRADGLAPGAEACRLVHGEADGLPGLVVDLYADVAVLQAGCRWADAAAPGIARRLVEAHGLRGVLARNDGPFRTLDDLPQGTALLAGEVPEEVSWTHAGIVRRVDPWGGQKTGTYLDQRENQRWAAEELPPGHALDAFCNDGGFALHLARGGRGVEALDSSRPALERLERHAAENGLAERITTRTVNVFEDLRARVAAGEHVDGIVLDPPALAKRKGDRAKALRAYKELDVRALRLLRPGGRLLACSCSFHVSREEFLEVLRAAAADARRDVFVRGVRGAAPCHPHLVTFPESDYLKAVLVEVG